MGMNALDGAGESLLPDRGAMEIVLGYMENGGAARLNGRLLVMANGKMYEERELVIDGERATRMVPVQINIEELYQMCANLSSEELFAMAGGHALAGIEAVYERYIR